MIKKFILFMAFMQLLIINSMSQGVAMADTMRSNGKIYVVVAVLVVIFVGIVVYLFSIDKKVSKLEKEIKQ